MVNRETFDAEVARLDAAIPRLNGDEVLVGLIRIVALVGNDHTHLDLVAELSTIPARIAMVWRRVARDRSTGSLPLGCRGTRGRNRLNTSARPDGTRYAACSAR